MDDVVLGDECIVGALTFIKAKEKFERRSLIAGNPAKVIRQIDDEMIAWKTKGTEVYQQLALDCAVELLPCEPLRDASLQKQADYIAYKIWQETKK
jgi:carbonic anhydrase/acetyltransferase-like protein (isoleucine patch superfamily)